MKRYLPFVLLGFAAPAWAEGNRQLDAHEHGVGALDVAIEGATVALAFRAPGADIVGFEYAAETAEDMAAIDAALATLAKPLGLFAMPDAAGCTVTAASAELEGEGHDAHGHEDHAHDAHDHEEHDHEEHAHDDHAHDDHADEEHGHAEASHTEFHAEYMLTCADPSALTAMTFPYFELFENARELEVQVVSPKGAQAFEVERAAPALNLSGLF